MILYQGWSTYQRHGIIWNLRACFPIVHNTIDDDSVADASIGYIAGVCYSSISEWISWWMIIDISLYSKKIFTKWQSIWIKISQYGLQQIPRNLFKYFCKIWMHVNSNNIKYIPIYSLKKRLFWLPGLVVFWCTFQSMNE